MRRAFTLIELLVIIAIIGVMMTVGVISISAGKGAARVKGATRDVFAAIRHARSTALVTMKPVIIEYSTVTEDGEPMAKIEITSAKLLDTSTDRSKVQTFSGEPLQGGEYDLVKIERSRGSDTDKTGRASASEASESAAADDSAGESLEEILFAPINTEVVRGMRIKAVLGDECPETETGARPSKISVFSNVDYLLGRYNEAKTAAKATQEGTAAADAKSAAPAPEDDQKPVQVVWETNGRVDPHQVWVYADGQKPEDGLLIKIDRFGAAKVLSGNGREDDE